MCTIAVSTHLSCKISIVVSHSSSCCAILSPSEAAAHMQTLSNFSSISMMFGFCFTSNFPLNKRLTGKIRFIVIVPSKMSEINLVSYPADLFLSIIKAHFLLQQRTLCLVQRLLVHYQIQHLQFSFFQTHGLERSMI